MGTWKFESFKVSHPVRDLENFFISCEKGLPMAGFSREGILCRDRFSANPTEVRPYSPTLSQNIPVFREVGQRLVRSH